MTDTTATWETTIPAMRAPSDEVITKARRVPLPEQVRACYDLLVWDAADGYVADAELPQVFLDRGKLTIGDVVITRVRFAEHITWSEESDAHYSSGHLYLFDGGIRVHGTIHHGATQSTARCYDVIGSALKPGNYTTKLTRRPASKVPAGLSAEAWDEGPALNISHAIRLGDTSPTLRIAVDGMDATEAARWSLKGGLGRLAIQLDERTKLNGYVAAPAELTFDLTDRDAAWEGWIGAEALWRAEPQSPESDKPAKTPGVTGPMTGVRVPSELSVADLASQIPDSQVEADSASSFMRNVQWAMGEDPCSRAWLSDILGQKPPVIDDPEQKKIALQSLSWYQSNFSRAWLTFNINALDGTTKPTVVLTEEQQARLTSYLRLDLARSRDLNIQQRGIFAASYKALKPDLAAYIADGGEKWAQALYDYLIEAPRFQIEVTRVSNSPTDIEALRPLTNKATLLSVLQPSGKLALAYYKAVLQGMVINTVPTTVQQDRDMIMVWLPSTLHELLRKIANGELPGLVDLPPAVANSVLENWVKNGFNAATAAAELMLSVQAQDYLSQTKGLEAVINDLDRTSPTIAREYPWLKGLSKVLLPIGFIGGLVMASVGIYQGSFDRMTTAQRGVFITECVQTVLVGFETADLLWTAASEITVPQWMTLTAKMFSKEILGDLGANLRSLPVPVNETIPLKGQFGENIPLNFGTLPPDVIDTEITGAAELSKLVADLEAGVSVEGSFWSKFLPKVTLEKALKATGAVAAGLMLLWAGWQLYDDVRDNDVPVSVVVFDALNFSVNFLFLAANLVGFAVKSAWLPTIGGALAIGGVILALIAAFVIKPKNPLDDFMTKFGVPFVKSLDEPKRTFSLGELFGDPAHDANNYNEVNFEPENPPYLLEIIREGGYGIVNMRWWDKLGKVIEPKMPNTSVTVDREFGPVEEFFMRLLGSGGYNPVISETSSSGWMTPDFDGEILCGASSDEGGTEPWRLTADKNPIDSVQFAYVGGYGLVNVRIHRRNDPGAPDAGWEPWMTPDQTDADATVAVSTLPRLCDRITQVLSWREARYGVVDACFGYANRI